MADRISDLPDSVICHILSFLPTKDAVATSVLSKQWKSLWRSVPAFNFSCKDFDSTKTGINREFLHSITEFLRLRDPLQPLKKFHLECSTTEFDIRTLYTSRIQELVTLYVRQQRLENLHLQLPLSVEFPSVIFSCKTLVFLKLGGSTLQPFSNVHLPSLKTLHLYCVFFSEYKNLAELFSGCPNLEDLKVRRCVSRKHCRSYKDAAAQLNFQKLPKLVRASVNRGHFVPLQVVSNVQFLQIGSMDARTELNEDLFSQFHNLTHIELQYWKYNQKWLEVFKVLNHCSKLQHLVIDQGPCQFTNYRRGDWEYPPRVPPCMLLHLKTCRVENYGGYRDEFEFARYIMQNATVLQHMVIRTHSSERERRKLTNKLSLFALTCELLIV